MKPTNEELRKEIIKEFELGGREFIYEDYNYRLKLIEQVIDKTILKSRQETINEIEKMIFDSKEEINNSSKPVFAFEFIDWFEKKLQEMKNK